MLNLWANMTATPRQKFAPKAADQPGRRPGRLDRSGRWIAPGMAGAWTPLARGSSLRRRDSTILSIWSEREPASSRARLISARPFAELPRPLQQGSIGSGNPPPAVGGVSLLGIRASKRGIAQ